MKRRDLVGDAGLVALVRGASALPARRPARIGILGTLASSAYMSGAQPRSPFAKALMQGLARPGGNITGLSL